MEDRRTIVAAGIVIRSDGVSQTSGSFNLKPAKIHQTPLSGKVNK